MESSCSLRTRKGNTKIKSFLLLWAVINSTGLSSSGKNIWLFIYHETLEMLCSSCFKTTRPQHGGAPPYTHSNITAFLSNWLRDLSRPRVSASCPPPSQDLTPPDFCVWGFVEDDVYLPPKPVTLSNLKDRIQTASAKTERRLVQNVWLEFGYPLDVRRATNGAHTELAKSRKETLWIVRYKHELWFVWLIRSYT
jgi:hypothetical protein